MSPLRVRFSLSLAAVLAATSFACASSEEDEGGSASNLGESSSSKSKYPSKGPIPLDLLKSENHWRTTGGAWCTFDATRDVSHGDWHYEKGAKLIAVTSDARGNKRIGEDKDGSSFLLVLTEGLTNPSDAPGKRPCYVRAEYDFIAPNEE